MNSPRPGKQEERRRSRDGEGGLGMGLVKDTHQQGSVVGLGGGDCDGDWGPATARVRLRETGTGTAVPWRRARARMVRYPRGLRGRHAGGSMLPGCLDTLTPWGPGARTPRRSSTAASPPPNGRLLTCRRAAPRGGQRFDGPEGGWAPGSIGCGTPGKGSIRADYRGDWRPGG